VSLFGLSFGFGGGGLGWGCGLGGVFVGDVGDLRRWSLGAAFRVVGGVLCGVSFVWGWAVFGVVCFFVVGVFVVLGVLFDFVDDMCVDMSRFLLEVALWGWWC